MDLIRQFNKFARNNSSLIAKALTSATNVGEALIPEHLEEVITNTIVRLSPELAVITAKFDNQKRHEFNRLTSLPAPGGAMGEGAVTPTRNATYARTGVDLKVVRRKGSVTNFLEDSSAKYVDASAVEMENHLLAHAYDLATYVLWGNALANQYEFSGLDTFIATNRDVGTAGGVVPTTLNFLDDMIDANTRKQGKPHKKCFLMSPEMLSKVSQLLTNVRLNQGITGAGLTQVEIEGGWRLMAYRDIPIIESAGVRPDASNGMGTVTTATATTGGTLPATTQYFFYVAPITYNGEELASAEVDETTGGTATNTITLSFTARTDAVAYKVYMGTSTGAGNCTLQKVVSAFTYDANGTITGDVTDIVISSPTPGSDVPSHMQSDLPLVATGGVPPEQVILWDLDEFQGLGKVPYTNTAGDRFNGLVTVKPLAQTDDDIPFLIKSYCALCDSFEATSYIKKNLRVD